MPFQNAYLTNGAYGYPGGQPRRVAPIALVCIHQTGNSPPVAMAREERDYANRAVSGGPSAHTYIDRAGGLLLRPLVRRRRLTLVTFI